MISTRPFGRRPGDESVYLFLAFTNDGIAATACESNPVCAIY